MNGKRKAVILATLSLLAVVLSVSTLTVYDSDESYATDYGGIVSYTDCELVADSTNHTLTFTANGQYPDVTLKANDSTRWTIIFADTDYQMFHNYAMSSQVASMNYNLVTHAPVIVGDEYSSWVFQGNMTLGAYTWFNSAETFTVSGTITLTTNWAVCAVDTGKLVVGTVNANSLEPFDVFGGAKLSVSNFQYSSDYVPVGWKNAKTTNINQYSSSAPESADDFYMIQGHVIRGEAPNTKYFMTLGQAFLDDSGLANKYTLTGSTTETADLSAPNGAEIDLKGFTIGGEYTLTVGNNVSITLKDTGTGDTHGTLGMMNVVNNGTITIAADSTIVIPTGVEVENNGTIENHGLIEIQRTDSNNYGTLNNLGTINNYKAGESSIDYVAAGDHIIVYGIFNNGSEQNTTAVIKGSVTIGENDAQTPTLVGMLYSHAEIDGAIKPNVSPTTSYRGVYAYSGVYKAHSYDTDNARIYGFNAGAYSDPQYFTYYVTASEAIAEANKNTSTAQIFDEAEITASIEVKPDVTLALTERGKLILDGGVELTNKGSIVNGGNITLSTSTSKIIGGEGGSFTGGDYSSFTQPALSPVPYSYTAAVSDTSSSGPYTFYMTLAKAIDVANAEVDDYKTVTVKVSQALGVNKDVNAKKTLTVDAGVTDRKSTRLNSGHYQPSRMPSSA